MEGRRCTAGGNIPTVASTIQTRPCRNDMLREKIVARDCTQITYVSIEHAPDGRVRFQAEDTNDHGEKKCQVGHGLHKHIELCLLRSSNEAGTLQWNPEAFFLGTINHLLSGMDCIYAQG